MEETARSTPLDNVIDVHIARLRRKVDDGYRTPLIHTGAHLTWLKKTSGTLQIHPPL